MAKKKRKYHRSARPGKNRDQSELRQVNERLLLKSLEVEETAERARETLTQTEAERTLLSEVLGQVLDGVIVVDIVSGRFLVMNSGAEKVFPNCHTVSDMLAYITTVCFHVDGNFYAAEDWPLSRTLATGERVANEEVGFTGSDGTRRTMLVGSGIVADATGRTISAVLSCNDITEQKRLSEAQRELAAREHAARADAEWANKLNQMKDEFLAVVSHELRTPLTPILGALHILRTRDCEKAAYKTAMDMIERNALAQARIIEDLLDISRVTHGKLSLNTRRVELPDIIAAAIDAFNLAAHAKNIEIKSELPETLVVLGDPERLTQVVSNLLANAIKFTPDRGAVVVRLTRTSEKAEIAVQDSGVGIDPEFLPHVFERFRQADSRMTRAYGGMGIGLAVVEQIVELHGGTVRAESEGKGHGSKFTVRLPLAA